MLKHNGMASIKKIKNKKNCFLLLHKYLGCTTNQTKIPFRYLLQLLVQGHQGIPLCFVAASQLKKLME